jgi:predicted polyphosphate/ATP-dependent NAD kinase
VAVQDLGGVSAGLLRAVEAHRVDRDPTWPQVELLTLPLSGRAADSIAATDALCRLGARLLVVLGGDGTDRVVASACGEVPIAAISTGTNNAFARIEDATMVGLAAGLVAMGQLSVVDGCRQSKVLIVEHGRRRELALVDVAVTTSSEVGARAIWNPCELAELYVTFAEPGAIGLSSIAALVHPVGRDEPVGARLVLGREARRRVMAPIAPGLVTEIGVDAAEPLLPVEPHQIETRHGVVSLDGEREIELRGPPATVTLSLDGPWCLDVRRGMTLAAARGLLTRG